MALITKSDFKGNIKISQNTKETNDLDTYINRNTNNILREFIGDYQYNLYLQNDTNIKYVALVQGLDTNENQIFYYDRNGIYTTYYGVVKAIQYFIYWDYVRNLNAKPTTVGIRFADAENSQGSTQLQVNNVIEQRYNLGVELFNCGVQFLTGVDDVKLYLNTITDDGNDTYSILFDQINGKNSYNLCWLLDIGDTFELDGKDYIVLSNDVGSNTSECIITFNEVSGKTFEKNHININPYQDYITSLKKLSVLDGMF